MKKLTFLTAILLATTTFAQIPNYVPTNGLVGWWPFNGNANDESGNGNNGTVNGATLTMDRFGNADMAYYFSSQNCQTYINTQINTASINGSLSVMFWVLRSGNGCISPRIMKFDNNDGPGTLVFQWPNNQIPSIGYVSSSSSYGFFPYQEVLDTTWSHIGVTISGNLGKLYQDGQLISDFACNGQITLAGNANFGRMTNPAYDALNGKLDDIGIWNRALTDCEIKDLYNSQLGSSNTTSSQTQTALDTYTWPVNNQTYTQSGTYSDTLVNAAGCDSIVTLNLTLSYTGINELNASQLVVSPNPTKDNFSISGLELLGTITSLEIKDAAGKVVKVLNPTATNFSCVGLKAGVYFLAVTSNKTERIIKIIKE